MSTKRDLVEAHGFNRRRLVTAFVSGAPGGREVEPVRHTRTVVGGVVLAVLLVAGAAVSGFLVKPPPDDWDQANLVIGKDSGSRFYAYQGTLFPVVNITSARLLMGEQKAPLSISDDLISQATPGPTIGIQGAPEVLPTDLVDDGWTACTNAVQGVRLTLAASPASTAVDDQAMVVSSEGRQYLLSGRYRYPVERGEEGQLVLRRLGLESEALPVSGIFLNLFEEGAPLGLPEIPRDGEQVQTGLPDLRVVGTPVEVAGSSYVLGPDATLISTSEFTDEVLQSSRRPVVLDSAQAAALESSPGESVAPTSWPETVPTAYSQPQSPCVRMDLAPETLPQVSLATPASADMLPTLGEVSRRVSPGIGAVVRAISGGVLDSGAIYLVDGSGTSYAVGVDGDGSSLAALGYAEQVPRPMPQPWLALFESGPALDPREANQPVTGGDGSS